MSTPSPQDFHARAIAAERAGNAAEAQAILAQGLAAHPGQADLLNSAGNIALRSGDAASAADFFGQALAARPGTVDFVINQAIALTGAGKPRAAIAAMAPFEEVGRTAVRYCSARGAAERAAGHPAEAAHWYDQCLALEPKHPRGLHGRARTAIERGEPDAIARVDAALAVNQGDADLWLARAQALDVAGETAEARQLAEQIVEQAPHWLEGLRFLAQMRHADGDSDFTSHYRLATQSLPHDPNIPADHCNVLAGLDYAAEAAEIAAEARTNFPSIGQFALLEAVNAGAADDDARADSLFASLDLDLPDRWLHEARHHIRLGHIEQAHNNLDRLLAQSPWDISGWALRGIAWRVAGDERAQWLHEQDGLVRLEPLADADTVLPPAIARLHELHDTSPMPLGQSLRGGSQTRGILFHRTEPEFAALHTAIRATLENYRAQLPPLDETHPLLRHRETPWQLLGSWSVRLLGGGDYHTAHIHPQGIVSSACYLELPEGRAAGDGALEVGRPAPDLRLDLPPLTVIEPEVAHLALFPSTLYHGTTPFGTSRRMTVAFDVVTREDA
ncbi:2OG-Fe(II) oxygenase family protein [Parerythrobacter jejuensis]|uniref:Tetratricopeptide repeat protein n=1 Tax=Parerythrobacter jejuensis TaxID=795812 RepID=A0A845AQ53_9SPHN|nr:putative 2OG-Fe(II) oxygenase [Parerythrobacter jejuensis]MXP31579.1 hypothetical protein [Parerythrobacter jejuensis]